MIPPSKPPGTKKSSAAWPTSTPAKSNPSPSKKPDVASPPPWNEFSPPRSLKLRKLSSGVPQVQNFNQTPNLVDLVVNHYGTVHQRSYPRSVASPQTLIILLTILPFYTIVLRAVCSPARFPFPFWNSATLCLCRAPHPHPCNSSHRNLERLTYSLSSCHPASNPLGLRYAKHPRNPFRIRTSKTQDLKSFRIRIYRKPGRGPLRSI